MPRNVEEEERRRGECIVHTLYRCVKRIMMPPTIPNLTITPATIITVGEGHGKEDEGDLNA